MKITRHHLTDELYRELLNRPSPSIESPSVVLQMALVPNEPASSSIDSFREALDRVCQDHQVQGPGPLNHHHVDFGKVSLRWEQHTEFSSVVLLAADQSTLDDFSLDWLSLSVGWCCPAWPRSPQTFDQTMRAGCPIESETSG